MDNNVHGWVAWYGGECPVCPSTIIDIKVRNGVVLEAKNAATWDWSHSEDDIQGGDIIAYRLSQTETERTNESEIQKTKENDMDEINYIKHPTSFLEDASKAIGDRAASRDVETERSMSACVRAFNAMYGKDLTEEEGNAFMVLLKMSRSKGGKYREDDYVDLCSFGAFMGEAASKHRQAAAIADGIIKEMEGE